MGKIISVPTGCIDVKISSIKDANVFDMKNYVYYPDNAYCCNLCLANVFHYIKKKTAANLFKKTIGVDPCDVFVGELNDKEKNKLTNDRFQLSRYMLQIKVKGVSLRKIKEDSFDIFEHQLSEKEFLFLKIKTDAILTHAIAVYQDKIFDGSFENVLKLNIHNLNLCASGNYKGIICGYAVKF